MDFEWIRVVLSQLKLIVRDERSFSIHYLNVVINPLCGNLDICLNYQVNAYFWSRNSVRAFRSQIATESERCFLGRALVQFSRFPSTRMHLVLSVTSASTNSFVNPVQELMADTPGIVPTLCYMTQKTEGD